MAGDKRILIDLLLDLASKPLEPSSLAATADYVRAAILLNSSNAPISCATVDFVEYGTSDGRQGLMVGGTLLSKVFETLAQQRTIPPGLAEREPDLTPEDWQATMHVVSRLLEAFEHPLSSRASAASDSAADASAPTKRNVEE